MTDTVTIVMLCADLRDGAAIIQATTDTAEDIADEKIIDRGYGKKDCRETGGPETEGAGDLYGPQAPWFFSGLAADSSSVSGVKKVLRL